MKSAQTNPDNKESKRGKSKMFKVIGRVLFICFAIIAIVVVGVVGVGAGVVSAFAKKEKIMTKADYDKLLTGWSQTSYAYFRPTNGGKPQLIGRMTSQGGDRVMINDLDQVSPYLINALISTEDREFWQHQGIVPKAIVRAAIQQMIGSNVQTGGSTLTQQLVKNQVLGDRSKSYERKTMEIIDAIRLEKYYNKKEILVKYLNSVDFGPGAHGSRMVGFASAAWGMFHTDVKRLTLPQAAYLAGMVQRPYDYNPFYARKAGDREAHLKAGTKRMKLVLRNMLETGKITQQQYNEAIHYDVAAHLAKKSDFQNGFKDYPYIITAVQDEAAQILKEMDEKKGIDKPLKTYYYQVNGGGYKYYTTIDKNMYDAVNNAVSTLHRPSKRIDGIRQYEQVGATIIDNRTGGILAFVGSAGGFDWLNRAFNTTRQPGSSIKPLLVYGPALNEGIISPDSTIIDEPIPKSDGSGYYKNANNQYHNGPVTATYALQWSLNIPAIKIFKKLGVQEGFDYLRKMDMPPSKYDGEAAALGGLTHGYTVTQMTAGYAMIANNGMFNKPHLIDKIVDSEGHVIYDYSQSEQPKPILKPNAATALRQMMRQVVTAGTAQLVGNSTGGYNVVGKTGTTSDQKDIWFIGSTPEISLGVWSGFDQPVTVPDHSFAQQAWVRIFKAAASAEPALIKKGSNFHDDGGVEFQCFECDRVPANPAPGQGQDQGQPGQSGQPAGQPGQPTGQPSGAPQPNPNPAPQPAPQPGPQPNPNPAPQPNPQPKPEPGPQPGKKTQPNSPTQ
jgi:penicillin-binding protein